MREQILISIADACFANRPVPEANRHDARDSPRAATRTVTRSPTRSPKTKRFEVSSESITRLSSVSSPRLSLRSPSRSPSRSRHDQSRCAAAGGDPWSTFVDLTSVVPCGRARPPLAEVHRPEKVPLEGGRRLHVSDEGLSASEQPVGQAERRLWREARGEARGAQWRGAQEVRSATPSPTGSTSPGGPGGARVATALGWPRSGPGSGSTSSSTARRAAAAAAAMVAAVAATGCGGLNGSHSPRSGTDAGTAPAQTALPKAWVPPPVGRAHLVATPPAPLGECSVAEGSVPRPREPRPTHITPSLQPPPDCGDGFSTKSRSELRRPLGWEHPKAGASVSAPGAPDAHLPRLGPAQPVPSQPVQLHHGRLHCAQLARPQTAPPPPAQQHLFEQRLPDQYARQLYGSHGPPPAPRPPPVLIPQHDGIRIGCDPIPPNSVPAGTLEGERWALHPHSGCTSSLWGPSAYASACTSACASTSASACASAHPPLYADDERESLQSRCSLLFKRWHRRWGRERVRRLLHGEGCVSSPAHSPRSYVFNRTGNNSRDRMRVR